VGQTPASWALVCAHWDSRPTADRDPDPSKRSLPVPGANDGASGSAIVLELARALADNRPPRGVILVLFDGEDYGARVEDMLLGSRYFAQHYQGSAIEFGVLLDMVGDRSLRIPIEGYSQQRAPQVVTRIWNAATAVGSLAYVNERGPSVQDDHIPLLDAGIPCIDAIDMTYAYWHTTADTPDKCSAASLAAAGAPVLHALRAE